MDPLKRAALIYWETRVGREGPFPAVGKEWRGGHTGALSAVGTAKAPPGRGRPLLSPQITPTSRRGAGKGPRPPSPETWEPRDHRLAGDCATCPQRETQVRRRQVTAPALPSPPAAARPLPPPYPPYPPTFASEPWGPRCPASRGEPSGRRPHSGGCGSAGSPGVARLAAPEPLHCDAARAAGQWARAGANR